MSDLPSGWIKTTIEEIAAYVQRGKSPKYIDKSDLPVINQRCIRWWGVDEQHLKFVDPEQWDSWAPERFLRPGDILWNSTGTGTVGRACLFLRLKTADRAVVDGHVTIVRVQEEISPDYLFRLIQSPQVQSRIDDMYSGSTNQVELSKSEVLGVGVPLPPTAEQRRIVARLDSLFARTHLARGELDHIPLLIEHYKRAILSAAFRGDLSAEWRLTHLPSSTELAAENLPIGWKRKELCEIAEIQSGLALGKKRKPNEQLVDVPYLRVANVQRGHLNLEEIKTLQATKSEIDRLLLKPGDIFMNEGGDRDKLGRGWIWSGEVEPCIHQNHVFRVRLYDENFPPKYVSYFANEFGQDYFFAEGTQTTNLASISKTKLSALPLPVPSSAEANEIVARIEAAFRWIEALTNDVGRAGQLLSRLDQTILEKAFRGELVPQDPNDEPASDLLERIRADREQQSRARNAPRRGRQANQEKKTTRRRKQDMGKKRAEVQRDHLGKTLSELGGSANAKDLWQRSEMDIDEFYKQLREEVKAGHIREGSSKDEMVLADAA